MTINSSGADLKSMFLSWVSEELPSEGGQKFVRHLHDLLTGIDEDTRRKCISKISEFRNLRITSEKQKLIESISPNVSQRIKIDRSFSALNFLIDALLNDKLPEGDYLHWAEDLRSLHLIDQKTEPLFNSILNIIVTEYVPSLIFDERKRQAEDGVLPRFKLLGTTVEARAIRKNRYQMGMGMSLQGRDAFSPDILGVTLISSIHIAVDVGSPKDFYFQVDEKDIESMIERLNAAKAEMKALKDFLKRSSEGASEENG